MDIQSTSWELIKLFATLASPLPVAKIRAVLIGYNNKEIETREKGG